MRIKPQTSSIYKWDTLMRLRTNIMSTTDYHFTLLHQFKESPIYGLDLSWRCFPQGLGLMARLYLASRKLFIVMSNSLLYLILLLPDQAIHIEHPSFRNLLMNRSPTNPLNLYPTNSYIRSFHPLRLLTFQTFFYQF